MFDELCKANEIMMRNHPTIAIVLVFKMRLAPTIAWIVLLGISQTVEQSIISIHLILCVFVISSIYEWGNPPKSMIQCGTAPRKVMISV